MGARQRRDLEHAVAPVSGRREKETDKIKVMIMRPGNGHYEPFLFRLSLTDFFQGKMVQVYGRPDPDASDRIIKVQKLVFRSNKDLDKVVQLATDSIIGFHRAKAVVRYGEKPDLSGVGDQVSRFLDKLVRHPAIEVNASLFPNFSRLGTKPA